MKRGPGAAGSRRSPHRPALATVVLVLASGLGAGARPATEEEDLRLDGGQVSGNLLANPSVEEGTQGVPQGWTFEGEGEGSWDSRHASHGRRSLRIDGVGAWRSTPFRLQEGRVTLIAADTRLEGSGRWGALVRLDFLREDGGRVGRVEPYRRDEHGWSRMRESDIAPPGTVRGVMVCYTYRDTDLRAWCDGLEVLQWVPDSGAEAAEVVGPMWRFDFGTASSAVQPGYVAVEPGSHYLPQVGHGWLAQVRLEGRDQTHGTYRPVELDEGGEPALRDRTLLDPLTRDYVQGIGAARFRVDVPPGRYQVFLLAGHSRPDESPPYFDLQLTVGASRAGRLSKRFPRVAFDWDTFPAEVAADGLTVGLSSDRFGGAWALSALVVYPQEAAAAGRNEQEQIVGSVEVLPADLRAESTRFPSPGLSPEPAAEAPAGGPPLQVLAGGWPEAGPPAERLAAVASPGLSADLRFSLVAEDGAEGLHVEVAPFRGPADAELPASAIRLRHIRDRALRHTHGYIIHDRYTVQPDELSVRLPRRLPPRRRAPFWARVSIAEGAPPGTYVSELRVDHRGGPPVTVPIEVRVLPFGTDDPGLFQNVYLYGSSGHVRVPLSVGVEAEAAVLRAGAVADIVDHLGTAALSVQRLPVYRRSDGGYAVELAFLRERLDDHRRAGSPARDALVLLQPVLTQLAHQMVPEEAPKFAKHLRGLPSLPADYWRVFGDLVESIDAELAAAGVQRRIYHPWDESFGDDLVLFAEVARVLRERLADPRVFCNVPTTSYYGGTGTDADRALAHHCNVWWVYGTLTDAQREMEIARGTWLTGTIEPVGPARARAAAGLLRWRRQEKGGNWWAYDAMRGSANTHLDGPSWGDRCLVYPTHPPSPRLAWESTRLGHEDLRYLITLARWVEEGSDDPAGRVRRAARKGRALLARLHQQLDPTLPEPLGSGPAYDRMRDEVIGALEAIHRARAPRR